MLRRITLALLLTLAAVTASAGTIHLLAPPSPVEGYFGVNDLPYTFVTGFDANTGNIVGVCRYTSYSGGRGSHPSQVSYACSWNLTGAPLGIGAQLEGVPQPVYGPMQTLDGRPVWVVATDSYGNHIGVLDGSPRIAVLVTP